MGSFGGHAPSNWPRCSCGSRGFCVAKFVSSSHASSPAKRATGDPSPYHKRPWRIENQRLNANARDLDQVCAGTHLDQNVDHVPPFELDEHRAWLRLDHAEKMVRNVDGPTDRCVDGPTDRCREGEPVVRNGFDQIFRVNFESMQPRMKNRRAPRPEASAVPVAAPEAVGHEFAQLAAPASTSGQSRNGRKTRRNDAEVVLH